MTAQIEAMVQDLGDAGIQECVEVQKAYQISLLIYPHVLNNFPFDAHINSLSEF
jgi:hypothetical protein